jgi:curved DNA-binding protein
VSRSFSTDLPSAVSGPADYWQVLALPPGADADSLKRAFRAQARRWHPDLNGNDPVAEERFKLVNEAYAVLSDPQRRQAWEAGEGHEPGREGSGPADPFASGFPAFETYLAALFGDRHAEQEPLRDDRDLVEEPADEPREPENPDGSGRPEGPGRRPRSHGPVAAQAPSPPPVQAGADEESLVELTPAQALAGERVELQLRDGTVVEVRTPPLAGDGWRLRLAGVAPGGVDHFLHLRVRTAEGLRVDGLRVLFQLDLHPADAALGCQVVVPTLDGPVRLRVPAGSSSGRLLRLRGRGQRWAERTGDQLVEIRIVVPEDLDEAEEALFRRLRELDRRRDPGERAVDGYGEAD